MLSRTGNDFTIDLLVGISGLDQHDVGYLYYGCDNEKYPGWISLHVDTSGIYSRSDDRTCSQEKRKLVKIHDVRSVRAKSTMTKT